MNILELYNLVIKYLCNGRLRINIGHYKNARIYGLESGEMLQMFNCVSDRENLLLVYPQGGWKIDKYEC